MKKFLLASVLAWVYNGAFAQTYTYDYKPEIGSSFGFGKNTTRINYLIQAQHLFYTKDEEYSGSASHASATTSNLIFQQLRAQINTRLNDKWYAGALLQHQKGRYFFYNNNRSFSSAGVLLGHKGMIDELAFYKEAGIIVHGQKPSSIKDIYLKCKIEYTLNKGVKPIALASLTAKADWLGTTFNPKTDLLFATRAVDDSFIKKVDQTWLQLQLDWFATDQMLIGTGFTYLVEYFPAASAGYDKQNLRHYQLNLSWKYFFNSKSNTITQKVNTF